jgi:hypothetical protein
VSQEAPGRLRLVQEFVNSVDLEKEGSDQLATPDGLAGWLRERELLEGGAPRKGDVGHAVALREALRELVLGHHGAADHVPDPGAADVVDAAARRARLELRFAADGTATAAPGGRRRRRSPRHAPDDRGRRPGRRHLVAAEGMPVGDLPLGVLRPLEEPLRRLVLDGRLRQPGEGRSAPRAPAGSPSPHLRGANVAQCPL